MYDVDYDDVLLNNLRPNSSWKTKACSNGWDYDFERTKYPTIVSEVIKHKTPNSRSFVVVVVFYFDWVIIQMSIFSTIGCAKMLVNHRWLSPCSLLEPSSVESFRDTRPTGSAVFRLSFYVTCSALLPESSLSSRTISPSLHSPDSSWEWDSITVSPSCTF